VIPLGLATLTQNPILVGARLTERAEGRVVLADALVTVVARDEASDEAGRDASRAPQGAAQGDLVVAELSLDAAGGLVCSSLGRLVPGTATALPQPAQPLVLRHAAERTIRQYFEGERFLELRTPTFGVCPGLDPHVHALGSVPGLGGPEHLMTSPELYMKRALAMGVPRCFQLAPVFRAEELGPWHEPEFTLIEWYRAYEGLDAALTDTEHLVCQVAETLRHKGAPSPSRTLDLRPPFPRLSVREAFRAYAGIQDSHDLAAVDPARYFQIFVDQVEPRLAELPHPIFLVEFPASQAALARLSPEDETVALRFELVLFGIELCNGYDELTDPSLQRARFTRELERRRAAGEPTYPLDERFLAALEGGMPPAVGNALGLERLLAVLTGAEGIEPFYAFPARTH